MVDNPFVVGRQYMYDVKRGSIKYGGGSPDYFNSSGRMDYVLDGKVLICTYEKNGRATLEPANKAFIINSAFGYNWYWKLSDFIELPIMQDDLFTGTDL